MSLSSDDTKTIFLRQCHLWVGSRDKWNSIDNIESRLDCFKEIKTLLFGTLEVTLATSMYLLEHLVRHCVKLRVPLNHLNFKGSSCGTSSRVCKWSGSNPKNMKKVQIQNRSFFISNVVDLFSLLYQPRDRTK